MRLQMDFLNLDTLYPFLKARRFRVWPLLDREKCGKILALGPRRHAERGFWWQCRLPKSIYKFSDRRIVDAATAVVDWVGKGDVIVLTDYLTDWRRLVQRYKGCPMYDKVALLLCSVKDRRCCGGILLKGCSSRRMARFAGSLAWLRVLQIRRGERTDAHIVPVDRPMTLRFQHDNTIWCYCENDHVLGQFERLCTSDSLGGTVVSHKLIGNYLVKTKSHGYLARITLRNGCIYSGFQDIGMPRRFPRRRVPTDGRSPQR